MKLMLIQLRAERNLTQLQLATRAEVSPMTIYKMEHGMPVAQESAEKVLAVLGVSADEVAGLVFSKPLIERVNRTFVRGALSRPTRLPPTPGRRQRCHTCGQETDGAYYCSEACYPEEQAK